jgi:hypothetical protein
MKTGNEVVDKISILNYSGNIIPNSWFAHIKRETGSTNLLAVNILADIIYWYRSYDVRDEATSQVIETKKKFSADKLQMWYDAWANKFGVTKEQVRSAVRLLVKLELIKKEVRNITMSNGEKKTGVTYFEPIPENIIYINEEPSQTHPPMCQNTGVYVSKHRGVCLKTQVTNTSSQNSSDIQYEQTVSDTQASPVTENGKGGEDGNPLLYLDTQKEEEEIGKGKEAIGKGKGCRTLENGILPEDGIPQTGETDGRGEDTQPEKENGTGSKEEFLARIKKGFGENSAEYELANILFYQDAQKLAKKYRTEYRFPIGDAEKFNSYKARIGRKPSSKKYYVAATNLYEMMPQSGKDKIDAYVNYELEMWDTSRTDDIESLRRKIMYEYFSLEPCFLHYYAMNEKQREYYKNRKPKKKKKKLDKELDRIYKDCGLDRNKDCDPGLDYDYEAGNLTEDELKAKLLAEVAA